jgi:uncharacterized integral membrane protein
MRQEGSEELPDRASTPPDAGSADRDIVQETREDREHLRALQQQRRSRVIKALVALVIVILLVIFIISNSQPVPVDFVFADGRPRLIWVMFACTVLGGVAGYLIGRPGKQIRLHRRQPDERR